MVFCDVDKEVWIRVCPGAVRVRLPEDLVPVFDDTNAVVVVFSPYFLYVVVDVDPVVAAICTTTVEKRSVKTVRVLHHGGVGERG